MGLNGKARQISDDIWKLTVYLGKIDGKYRRRTKEVEIINPDPEKAAKKAERLLRDFISEVEKELAEAEAQKQKEQSFIPSDMPLCDYLRQFLNIVKPNLERNTHESYTWEIEHHINPVLGHIPLGALTPGHIQEFYIGKLEHGRLPKRRKDGTTQPLEERQGLSVRSVRYLHSILRQALEKAVDLEYIQKNPCAKISPPTDKRRQEEKIVCLDAEQLTDFLSKAEGHPDYALIYTAAYTGMRQSELLALTWDNVLWKESAIRVAGAVNLLESGEFDHGRTKNESSTRVIDITSRTLEVLKRHQKAQREEFMKSGVRNKLNLVFPDKNGNYMNRKNLAGRFRNLADKCEFYNFTFHGLRHTHATILLAAGWYPNDVSKRLGHADIDTTLRVYGHVIPKNQKKLAAKFDELVEQK
jgi:integrase